MADFRQAGLDVEHISEGRWSPVIDVDVDHEEGHAFQPVKESGVGVEKRPAAFLQKFQVASVVHMAEHVEVVSTNLDFSMHHHDAIPFLNAIDLWVSESSFSGELRHLQLLCL